MKPFDLEEYLKNPSRKVVTRDGREVRIVCTDFKNKDDYKIVALITKNDREEIILCYRKSGKDKYFTDLDLFFTPIKKEGWVNIYKGITEKSSSYLGQKIYKSEYEALKNKIGDNSIATTRIEWEE